MSQSSSIYSGVKCISQDCVLEAKAKGMCKKHYGAAWIKNNPDRVKQRTARNNLKNKEANAEWRKRNKRRMKGHHLRKFWPGASWQEALANYDQLVITTNNLCQICFKPEVAIDWQTMAPKELAVDHCHKTGKVRGLLCQKHNHVLGLVDEDLTLLDSMKAYISKN